MTMNGAGGTNNWQPGNNDGMKGEFSDFELNQTYSDSNSSYSCNQGSHYDATANNGAGGCVDDTIVDQGEPQTIVPEGDEDPIVGVVVNFNTYEKTDYECGEVPEYTGEQYEFMKVAMIMATDTDLIAMLDAGNYDAISHIEYFGDFEYKEQNYADGVFDDPQIVPGPFPAAGTYIVGTFTETFDIYSWYQTAVVYALVYIDIEALNAAYGLSYESSTFVLLGVSELIYDGGSANDDADSWSFEGGSVTMQMGETDDPSEEALEESLAQQQLLMQGFQEALGGMNQGGQAGTGPGAGSGPGQEGIV